MRPLFGQRALDALPSYEEKVAEVLRVLTACGGCAETAALRLDCLPSTVRGIARDETRRVARASVGEDARP